MLTVFVIILAALGAAFVLRGRAMRGLLVILIANMAAAGGAAATGRWGWMAFSWAMCFLCGAGIALARREQ